MRDVLLAEPFASSKNWLALGGASLTRYVRPPNASGSEIQKKIGNIIDHIITGCQRDTYRV